MSAARATLILVHGAWHGSWCWQRLLPHLAERGIAARTVDLPSVVHQSSIVHQPSAVRQPRAGHHAGLREDANAVRAVIDSIDGPVVLCGHSYGGMVISLAASRRTRAGAASGAPVHGESQELEPRASHAPESRIRGLIYLCAFMPEPRQSLVGIGGNQHAPWIRLLEDGLTLPDLSLAGEVFYGDCDAPTREWALAQLKPQWNAAFTAPVARPAWKDIPSTYVVCARDAAMPPELQRTQFAPRASRSIELDASHSPFLSQPAALADALAGAL